MTFYIRRLESLAHYKWNYTKFLLFKHTTTFFFTTATIFTQFYIRTTIFTKIFGKNIVKFFVVWKGLNSAIKSILICFDFQFKKNKSGHNCFTFYQLNLNCTKLYFRHRLKCCQGNAKSDDITFLTLCVIANMLWQGNWQHFTPGKSRKRELAREWGQKQNILWWSNLFFHNLPHWWDERWWHLCLCRYISCHNYIFAADALIFPSHLTSHTNIN